MPEIYTNLPPKDSNTLDKTIEKLTTTSYQTNYEFSPAEYDAAIGFFAVSYTHLTLPTSDLV